MIHTYVTDLHLSSIMKCFSIHNLVLLFICVFHICITLNNHFFDTYFINRFRKNMVLKDRTIMHIIGKMLKNSSNFYCCNNANPKFALLQQFVSILISTILYQNRHCLFRNDSQCSGSPSKYNRLLTSAQRWF